MLKIGNHTDFTKTEIRNVVVQPLGSDPSSPTEGQVYYNTSSKKLRQYDGSGWIEYGTGSGGGDVSQTSASGSAGRMKVSAGANKTIADYSGGAGIVKSDADGVVSPATSGTDYAPATSGSAALKGNGSGGFSSATLNDVGAATSSYSLNGQKITSLGDPTASSDAANKQYVDNAVQGLSWKAAVRAASTANLNLSNALENGDSLDGLTLATGDRVLVKDQSTASQNGIYVVQASGAAVRATDADAGAELVNATMYVSEGTANADTVWTCTTNASITVGSTNLTFAQVNGGSVPQATTTTQGKVELATQAEAEGRTDADRAVTPAALARFPYTTEHTIGDNSATQIDITHNRGTKAIITQVRQASDDQVVECDIKNLSTTVVRLNFAVAPATDSLVAVVMG